MASTKQQKQSYLVCVNNEDYSAVALRYTCQLAAKDKSDIIILHVIEPANFQSLGIIVDTIRHEKKAETKDLLKQLSQQVLESTGSKPKLLMREGVIEEEISQVVQSHKKVKMLVVGCSDERGNSEVLAALIGSLGKKLGIPMLTVPGNSQGQG